jgi:rubrerythrin
MATRKKPTSKKTTETPEDESELTPQEKLLYQALETEIGGVEIYETALRCVQNDDLRDEWEEYLEQTKRHVQILNDVCTGLRMDPERATPGRDVVRHIGEALVKAMQMAIDSGDEKDAEMVAAECVTLAETKDHANWGLIGALSKNASTEGRQALSKAHEEVEDEEDEHLYHTAGWARELALDALGLPAELPPPEEEEDVHSAEEAAQVKEESVKSRSR